jgi:energy-coupling factor transporter ATP-binding protein EcfA2
VRLKDVGPFADTTIEFPEGTNPELADTYLIVGENGCGKTTVLHGLVTALSWEHLTQLNARSLQFARRFTSSSSEIQVKEASGASWVAGRRPPTGFSGDPAVHHLWNQWLYGSTPLSWAVFTYAGARGLRDVHISAITEMPAFGLENALTFEASVDATRLAQWIANQDYRRMKLQDGGKSDQARAVKESIARIERAVSTIIQANFTFHISPDRLTPDVKVDGTVLEFGLLPDGLKSIVSWISDLLMRLSEIPWVNDTPVVERSFLLLLDEIDIHLHPAWQRRVLPAVQALFPKAQIIATTHSPFVVTSLKDGAVIELKIGPDGKAVAQKPLRPDGREVSLSYATTLRTLFGIASDFDIDTEEKLKAFHQLATDIIRGGRREEIARLEDEARKLHDLNSEEVSQLVQFELNQVRHALPR